MEGEVKGLDYGGGIGYGEEGIGDMYFKGRVNRLFFGFRFYLGLW